MVIEWTLKQNWLRATLWTDPVAQANWSFVLPNIEEKISTGGVRQHHGYITLIITCRCCKTDINSSMWDLDEKNNLTRHSKIWAQLLKLRRNDLFFTKIVAFTHIYNAYFSYLIIIKYIQRIDFRKCVINNEKVINKNSALLIRNVI